MPQLRVAVDVQHLGKSAKPLDRGASFYGLSEVGLVLPYAREIARQFEARGHLVFWSAASLVDGILDGEYRERHAWANAHAADLYFACHLNSADPPGDYGLVEIDTLAGNRTRSLAREVADAWQAVMPISRCLVKEIKAGDRGRVCISGETLKASGLLLEPLFLNNPQHFEYLLTLNGPMVIADAVVRAAERVFGA